MVKRHVATGCSNTNADGVSIFRFPKDPGLHTQLIKSVQRYRAEWTDTAYSVLCSKHFEDQCFEPKSKIAASFDMKKVPRLKPDAVTTIFSQPSQAPSTSQELKSKRKQSATKSFSTLLNSVEFGAKKKRSAYEKSENYRVMTVIPR